jgi:hypothetical protein
MGYITNKFTPLSQRWQILIQGFRKPELHIKLQHII